MSETFHIILFQLRTIVRNGLCSYRGITVYIANRLFSFLHKPLQFFQYCCANMHQRPVIFFLNYIAKVVEKVNSLFIISQFSYFRYFYVIFLIIYFIMLSLFSTMTFVSQFYVLNFSSSPFIQQTSSF